MKKLPYGEADFLVHIFTKDFGKMDVLAKGARKSGAKLNAHIDILNHVRISFVKSGERMPTLIDAEVINRHDDWFLDADKISIAGRMLQTLDLLIPIAEKDEILFATILNFFGGGKSVQDFLPIFFAHQGYGKNPDFSLLPSEISQSILTLWPALKN